MPIYEYNCQECGHELEALQKISDEPLVFCPGCGMESLKKKISAAAFRLKGTGWYETDFKNNGKQDKTEKTNAAEGSGKSAGDNDKSSSTDATKSSKDKSSSISKSDSSSASSSTKSKDSGSSASAA